MRGWIHLYAFYVSVICGIVLVASAYSLVSAKAGLAVTVYAVATCGLFGVSATYHRVHWNTVQSRTWMKRADHSMIFLFIAGSYMPFLLGVLRGAWGWSLFGVVWAAATLGVVSKMLDRLRHPLWSTGLYVAMGWVVLVAAVPLVERMAASGLAWLVAGGVSYTVGAVVYLFDARLRYAHFAWHLFVMGGTACHFCAALWHAAA